MADNLMAVEGKPVWTLPERPIDGTHKEWRGLRNLMPHPLRLIGPWAPADGPDIILEPWGDKPYRLAETSKEHQFEARDQYRGMTGLTLRVVDYSAADAPQEEPGVTWLVSLPALLGLAAAGVIRPDIMAPDTGSGALRDASGTVIGASGFVSFVLPPEQPVGKGKPR